MAGKYFQAAIPGIGTGRISGGGYSVNWTFLGNANSALSSIVNIRSEADFLLRRITFDLTNITAGGPVLSGDLVALSATLQIVDQADGKSIFQNPPTLNQVAGTAQRPYAFTSPFYFAHQGSFQVTVTPLSVANLTAADTYQLTLAFDGDNLWLPFA